MPDIKKKTYDKASIWAKGNTVTIEGEIASFEPSEFIVPFFDKIWADYHHEMKHITIDIKKLKYLNSSGIAAILKTLRRKPKHIKVTIQTNSKFSWQAVSVQIFKIIDKEMIDII